MRARGGASCAGRRCCASWPSATWPTRAARFSKPHHSLLYGESLSDRGMAVRNGGRPMSKWCLEVGLVCQHELQRSLEVVSRRRQRLHLGGRAISAAAHSARLCDTATPRRRPAGCARSVMLRLIIAQGSDGEPSHRRLALAARRHQLADQPRLRPKGLRLLLA